MNMKKVINKSNLILWIVAIAALIGMIIYIVTSVTGYLTDAVMNPMPVICTVVAIIAAVFAAIGEEKVNAIVYDILIVVVSILLLVSFYWFILGRVSLAADVYFIPVNYPAAEADTIQMESALMRCATSICNCPKSTLDEVSEPVRNTPIQPIRGATNGNQ